MAEAGELPSWSSDPTVHSSWPGAAVADLITRHTDRESIQESEATEKSSCLLQPLPEPLTMHPVEPAFKVIPLPPTMRESPPVSPMVEAGRPEKRIMTVVLEAEEEAVRAILQAVEAAAIAEETHPG